MITSKDDDIASEPDIVQDREEFMNEMRKHKKELEMKKSSGKAESMDAQSPRAAEAHHEHVKFAHAPEIAGNAQKAVRIRAETQEEAPVAVENMSANKMNDQADPFNPFTFTVELVSDGSQSVDERDNTGKCASGGECRQSEECQRGRRLAGKSTKSGRGSG